MILTVAPFSLVNWQEDWVLCRVFHKRKGELVATSSGTLENLESSPPFTDDQSMPGSCSEMMGSAFPTNVPHQEGNSSSSFLNLAVLHYNFLEFPHELDASATMMGMGMGMGSKDEDDYGFLLDVELDDDRGMGMKGSATDVEDIRF